MSLNGTLKVRPIGAALKDDKDTVGKMDPYVVLELGSQKFTTIPSSGMGKAPVWNEEFSFNVTGNDTTLSVKVYDSDAGKDDFLGQTSYDLKNLPAQGGVVDNNFPLQSRILHTNEGSIHLKLEWHPGFQAPPPHYGGPVNPPHTAH